MKKIIAIFLISLALYSCASSENSSVQQQYVQGSGDIPLMQGLEKISDQALGFDSSQGSIVTSSYQTMLGLEQVVNFYSKTLPQLGWNLVGGNQSKLMFSRDNEKLEIEMSAQNGKNSVTFFISAAF